MVEEDIYSLPEIKVDRVNSLDRFRGFAIALMLMFGAAKMFTDTDFFVQLSTHDLSLSWQLITGYGFYDIIAPLFVFASGLAFHYSTKSSCLKNGSVKTRRKNLVHSLKILGVGSLLLFDFSNPIGIVFFTFMILSILLIAFSLFKPKFKNITRKIFHYSLISLGICVVVVNIIEVILALANTSTYTGSWGALTSIGIGMLIATFIVDKEISIKCVFIYAFIIVYFCLCLILPEKAFLFTHGGIMGALGYAILFILADVVLSLKDNKVLLLIFTIPLFISSAFIYDVILPSKETVTITYVLFSFVFCYTVYLIFDLLELPGVNFKFPVLTILGKNSLTAYCLHFALTFTYGICINALISYLPMKGVIQIILYALGMILYAILMALLLRYLSKKNLVVRI